MHTSIAATGAKVGDRVKCLGAIPNGPNDDRGMSPRFMKGQTYKVTDHAGRPAVRGGTDYRGNQKGGGPGWNIPWLGFGYHWELA